MFGILKRQAKYKICFVCKQTKEKKKIYTNNYKDYKISNCNVWQRLPKNNGWVLIEQMFTTK